jgi:hypothetical protein
MSIIDKSKISEEEQRLTAELEIYRKLMERAKNKNKELSKTSEVPSKPIELSSLRSPTNNKTTQLSNKEELQNKIKRCSECLIAYGRELL